MADFTKTELETILKDTEEHLAETKMMGPGYYKIRERYDYAVEADERYIEKLKKQIAEYDQGKLNSDQQIVLDVLKEESLGTSPFFTIWHAMENDQLFDSKGMDTKQQFQVLVAFSEWGMKEVAE